MNRWHVINATVLGNVFIYDSMNGPQCTLCCSCTKVYQPTAVNSFHSNCPTAVFLVQLLLSKCATDRWLHFLPHLLTVKF